MKPTEKDLHEMLNKACEIITNLEADLGESIDEVTAMEIQEFFYTVNLANENTDLGVEADLDAQDPKWGKNKI